MRQPDDYTETEASFIEMSNRISELEIELSAAIKIIDDGDRYSNNLEYIDSPYCAVVREFLFKHGVISEEERPKLKLESITEIKNENEQLAKDKAELVRLVESGYKEALRAGYSCGLSDGQCYSSNKISMNVEEEWLESMTIESLEKHK